MKQKNVKKKANSTARKSSSIQKKTEIVKARAKTATKPAARKPAVKVIETSKRKERVVYQKEAFKGTFNTHDIMHAPVEKTIRMLEKIIAGERLFTM